MEEIINNAHELTFIRVFGSQSLVIPQSRNTDLGGLGIGTGEPRLIRVAAIGSHDHCHRVIPFYLLVAGEGQKPEGCDLDIPDGTKMWKVLKSAVTTMLIPSSGSISDLLSEATTEEGERLGLLDLRFKGSLKVEVVERPEGKICLKYQISGKAEYRALGSGWKTIVRISEDGTECLQVGACIEVIDNDFITAKLCYEPAANRVCLKGRIGYKGASASFKECVQV